ncbi:MAG: ribosome maturation factor RimM [Candidatus Sumerlaeia bacterium]
MDNKTDDDPKRRIKSKTGKDDLVTIGILIKPRGLKGEIKTRLTCEGPEHFEDCVAAGKVWLWFEPAAGGPSVAKAEKKTHRKNLPPKNTAPRIVHVENLRFHQGDALVKFEGVNSIDEAENFRGGLLGMLPEDLPRWEEEEESYYHYELEGLRVYDINEHFLGTVLQVEEGLAHDQLLIKPAKKSDSEIANNQPYMTNNDSNDKRDGQAKKMLKNRKNYFRIPLVAAIVLMVDVQKGIIQVDLPQGLIESQN